MNQAALIISNILNPLVVIVALSFFLVFAGTGSIGASLMWGLITLAFASLLFFFIWFLVKKKVFVDFDVSTQKQRPLLFLIEIVFTSIYLFILLLGRAPLELIVGIILIILILVTLAIVNNFIKASGHVAMFSAAITLLVFMSGLVYLLGFVFVPLLAWSRIKLKRHTLSEVVVGVIIGILITVILSSV